MVEGSQVLKLHIYKAQFSAFHELLSKAMSGEQMTVGDWR